MTTYTDQQRKDMAAYVNATDPYNHHIVLHTNVKEQAAVYTPLLGSASDLTGVSIQTDWNNVYKETREWVEKSANAGKKWVVANDEQNSVGVSTDANYAGKRGNVADNQDDMRKEALWGNLMGGGTGVEYYFGGNTGETDLAAEDFRSRAKMYRFTRYALDFFRTYVPLADSKPLNNVNNGWVIGQEGKVYIIYLKKGGTSQINTEGGRYTVQWYDPRNGGDLQSGTVRTISGGGSKSIGNPPNSADQDWVVLLRASQLTQPDPVPQTLYRVNAGGSSFTTSEGTVFSADNYASGGSLYTRSGDITNSAQDTLYLSERYGNFSYNFPVTNGSYTVVLHFAEIYASDSNQRTFHVDMEGQRMLTGYDIFARAGGAWKAVQERFTVAVRDGMLTIDFESVLNNAKVSAIEVMAAATNAPPVLSPIGEQAVQAGSTLTVPLSASDTDGDAVTITALNLPEFAQLNNNVLTFAPGSGDVGRYPITVRATDSQQATDEETFTLVVSQAETAALAVTSFTLMNADTDGEIQELTDGAQLNLATLPTRNLNIRANTGAGPVGSVKLVLSGKQNRTQNEVGAPYALFADSDGDYRPWTPTVGSYSLSATPFPDAKGSGTAGRALTVSFSVISQAPAGRAGLEAQAESAGLTVLYYPNPFSESFTLQLRESSAGKRPVFIYDHTGRKVWERDDLPTGKHLIQPGQHLAPGLYILQIGQGPGAQRMKLIKTP
ncbi:malectin domain-containing carbohydrate-binding protein [Larkinella arboricola]|nr:malectin domain-containing carbohydrate-binding protein [Larkinella arboricola]